MTPSENVPAWLKPGLNYNMADFERIGTICSNWLRLHSNMDALTELDVLRAIVIEYRTTARPLIIGRLKNRFDRMRTVRENQELSRVRL